MSDIDRGPGPLTLVDAAALVHRVPDGVLAIEHDNGNRTIVSYGPDAQMNPCELRALVGAHGSGRFVRSVDSLEVGGALATIGGGVHVREVDGRLEGWFVTSLHPLVAQSALSACELPVHDDECVDVHLVADSVLDVTVGSVRLGDRALDGLIDEIALRLRAACAAEEVVAALILAPTPGSPA